MYSAKFVNCLTAILLIFLFSLNLAHALPGDLNSSGRVDGYDLIIFSRAYGSTTGGPDWNPTADLDANGVIDQADLDILSFHFGKRGVSFGLWVGDQWTGIERVSRLSHTGNLLGRFGSFNYPFSISSNVSDGTVWVADYNNDKVVKLSPVDGSTLITVSGMDAYSVSVNAKDGSVWVADYTNDRVLKLLPAIPDGYNITTDTGFHIVVSGFDNPRSVSVIPETGIVWVADSYNNRIVRLFDDISDNYDVDTDTGSHAVKSGFLKPYAVSGNVSDGTVWVADYDNNDVVKLSSSGMTEIVRVGGFTQPFALAVNYIDDSIWIADRGNDRVVRLGADGSFLAEIPGVDNPYSISVNPISGNCWVAEYDTHQVVEYSPAGMEISRLSGFTNPISVSVTPEEALGSTYPFAEASLSSNTVNVGETVDFNGSGSDPDGEIIKYEWDFDGDGTFDYSSSETGIASHAYSNAGIYNPVFRVTDNHHLTAADYSPLVRVGNLEAMAGADTTSGSAPLTVNFTAGYVEPLDGYIDTYQWDFDGDNLFEYYDESTGNTSHTYSEAGTYTALLKITDGEFTAIDTITITVSSSLPSASASASLEEGKPPLSVDFSGSGTDPDGSIVLFEWDFDGDGTYDWHSVSGGNTTHHYDASGLYNARFRVTDNDGNTDIQEIALTVTPVAISNADLTEGHGPLLVTFNANGSHDDNGSIANYEWDFGECTFYDAMEIGTSNWTADAPWAQIKSDYYSRNTSWTDSPAGDYASYADTALTSSAIDLSTVVSAALKFRHHYETQSDYDFCRVEISTDGGLNWTELAAYSGILEAWSEALIDISSFLPSADCKVRFRLTSNSGTNYDGWYVDDVSLCTENWVPSTDGTASHTYNNPGAYTAALRVTDNDSIQALDTIEIKVIQTGLPIAAASADIETGMAPLTVNFSGAGSDPDGSITSYEWNFGEEYVWVADYGSHQVFHLASDGSDLAIAGGFINPISVSANPDDGTVWIADNGNNQVVRLAADGTEWARVGGFSYPLSVSVNSADGTVWVADRNHNQVVKLGPDGAELLRVSGFAYPYSVSVNPADGGVWVADYNNHQVAKLDSNGTQLIRVSGFYNPRCVSVNSADGTVWVADYGNDRVIKLEPSINDGYTIGTHTGSHTLVDGFDNPVSVSVNSADGTVWVADNYNSQVVKLDAAGTELVRKNGFDHPYSVSVNSTDGTVWVADYNNDEIVKLASDGTELVRLGGFDQPRAVAVTDTGVENSYSSSASGDTSHTYSVPGIYRAELTVTDNEGNIDQKTVLVRVYGAPTVTAQSDISTGKAPLEVFFSGAATDLDGHIVEYAWDFDSDGLYDVSSQSTANARHVYANAGVYNAVLRAKDDDGYTAASTAVVVTVGQSLPVATAYAGPVMGNAPLDVSFSGSGTDPDGTITTYEWDFDTDGTYDYSSSTSAETTHAYDTAGSYTATLRISDNDGNTATDTKNIEVNPAGTPFAMLHAEPLAGTNPLEVRFWGFGFDPDGSISNYEWNFDNDDTFDSSSGNPPSAFGDTMEFGESYWTADAPWARIYMDYHSNTYCWADSPEGDYDNNTDASLITATIDLSGSVAPRLVFWHHYALASGDYGRVYISGNNGSSWTELGYFTNSTLSRWSPVTYDISAYAGNPTVKIRFRIYSNSSVTADGWYIDDVWVGDRFTHSYPNKGNYTAVFRVTDNESNQTAVSTDIAVMAHQNASFVWVADTTHRQIVKLSHDGIELARISGFNQPYAVDVVPDTGDVWVADKANDRVVALSVDTPDGYHTSVARITDDSAGDNNTGLLFGDAQLGTGSLGGGGLSLDGNGDYVLIPPHTDLYVQSFTVEAWIKTATYSGYPAIFMRGNTVGGDETLIYLYNNTTIRVYLDGSYWSFQDSEFPVTLTDDTWHHIAVIHDADADQLKCYIDGAQYDDIKTVSKFLDFGGSRSLIGADFDAFNGNIGNYFNGEIDDVRLWNTARTGAEIADNMNSELTGSEAGLVGYWKLNSTPDTPYHKTVTGFHDPYDVSVYPADSSVWVADYYNDRVVKLFSSVTNGYDIGADTGFHIPVGGFNDPISVSVNTADNTLWVADYNNHQVVKLDANGTELVRVSGLYNPYCVSVNSTDGSVWVADYNNDRVVKLLPSVSNPYNIGTDSGSHITVSNFENPRAVAVNSGDGTVWVSDTGNQQVVKLTGSGTEILRLSGFNNPRGIAIDPKNGTAWVADYNNDRVVKLSPGGTELETAGGFDNTMDVAIDTGERNIIDPPAITSAGPATEIGNLPLDVDFAVTATDNDTIARYQWDFDGDGTWDYDSALSGDTSYTFNIPGTYTPVLSVTDNEGLVSYDASKTVYVGPSTVYATVSSSDWDAPTTFTLNGYVKGLGPGRHIVLYEWDFEGDGVFDWSGSINAEATNTYQTGNTYAAVLRVTDDLGNRASGSVIFTINKTPPTVSNTASPYSGVVPLNVTLNSTGADADGSIVLYEWDYDGDGTYDWFSDSEEDTVFTYTEAGTYNPTVRFTDNDGLTTTAAKTITVSDRQDPPSASASADITEGNSPLTISFTGSGTDPDDGTITLYEWDFDGDGTYDESSGVNGDTSYTYNTPGLYRAVLQVTDSDGLTDTSGVRVNVKGSGVPTAAANADLPSGDVPLIVNFDASGSTDPDGSIVQYEWIFSDEGITVIDRLKVYRVEYFAPEVALTGIGEGTYNRLVFSPVDASVWVCDEKNKRVVKLNSNGARELEVSGFNQPVSLSADPNDGSIWVADNANNQIVKILPSVTDGYDISLDTGSHIAVSGFSQPRSVSVDASDGLVWVADRNNHQVKKLDAGGGLMAQVSGFSYPAWVAVDQNSGDVWVADRSNDRVVKLAADIPDGYNTTVSASHHWSIGGFSDPSHVAVDPNDGTVWVCDPGRDEVIKVTSDAARMVISIGDLNNPNEVLVNADSSIWIADTGNHWLLKASPKGHILRKIAGFNTPQSIALFSKPSNSVISADGNATYIYSAVGEYSAALKVTDNDGLSDMDFVTVKTDDFPESLPMAYPVSGKAPLEVLFAANGSSPTSTIESFEWDFDGNGTFDWSSAISNSSTYTYPSPGAYQANLKVTDNRGLSDTKSVNVTVTLPDEAPAACAAAQPVEGASPLEVGFSGLGVDLDGTITKFEWDFDGDGTYDFASTSSGFVTHTYNAEGLFIAKLRVTDNDNNTATDTVYIEVKEAGAPTAVADAGTTSGAASLDVAFTGSGNDDGSITLYEWDFDGDGVYDWNSTTAGDTVHHYTEAGFYKAVLRVTDDSGKKDVGVVDVSVSHGLSVTLSTDSFDPTVGENVSIDSVLAGEARVAVRIIDRAGNIIRTLVENTLRPAGYYTDIWDGKDDQAQTVNAGVYLYTIEYTAGGKTYIHDVTGNVDPNPYTPDVLYPTNIDPFNPQKNFFRFTLDTKSEVTVYVSYFGGEYGMTGPRVKTLLLRSPRKAGSYVLVWDGTDDAGMLTEPHQFVTGLFAWQLPENAMIVVTDPVISDLNVSPGSFNPSSNPYAASTGAEFKYTLSKTSDVTVTIFNSANYAMRTETISQVPGGYGNKFVWDGKDDSGRYVSPGNYRAKLIATDNNGNQSRDANALLTVFY